MERLCGYLILGGLLFCGIGAYRWYEGEAHAGLIALGGVILVVAGFWLSGRYGEDDEAASTPEGGGQTSRAARRRAARRDKKESR